MICHFEYNLEQHSIAAEDHWRLLEHVDIICIISFNKDPIAHDLSMLVENVNYIADDPLNIFLVGTSH